MRAPVYGTRIELVPTADSSLRFREFEGKDHQNKTMIM